MEQEQMNYWHEFSEQANLLVREETISIAKIEYKTKILLTINKFPSFSNPVSWKIYKQVNKLENNIKYIATRREWQKDIDLIKFETPLHFLKYKFKRELKPTMKDNILEIPNILIEKVMELISINTLSFYITTTQIGCDGESYELFIGDFWAGIKLNWWENGPEAWANIVYITKNILNDLEIIIANSNL